MENEFSNFHYDGVIQNNLNVGDEFIPFLLNKDEALRKYKLKNLFSLKPWEAINKSVLEKVNKVYIPIYVDELLVSGNVVLQTVNIVRSWEDKDYSYDEIKRSRVGYNCKIKYDKQLSLRNDKIDEKILEDLTFDFVNLVGDNNSDAQVLESNVLDYDISNKETNELIAKSLNKVRTSDTYKQSKVEFNNLVVNLSRRQGVFIPLYLFNFQYKNKDYLIVVNGQNGEVIESLPNSMLKLGVIFFGIFVVVFSISLLITYFL